MSTATLRILTGALLGVMVLPLVLALLGVG